MNRRDTGNSRFPRALALATALLGSCAQLDFRGEALHTPLCSIWAEDSDLAEEILQVVAAVDAPLREFLGAESAPAPRIQVRPRVHYAQGATTDDGITILNPDPVGGLRYLVTHELTHWYLAHGDDYWDAVPMYVQEGLAKLTGQWMTGYQKVTVVAPGEEYRCPTIPWKRRYLAEQARLKYSGMWVIASLGLDELKEMAISARASGHQIIPAEVLEAALPRRTQSSTIPSPFPEFQRETLVQSVRLLDLTDIPCVIGS